MPCIIAPCRRILTYFQYHQTILTCNQGHQTWHLGPLVKERSDQKARYGKDWAERQVGAYILSWQLLLLFGVQNDVLSWLIEITKGRELSLEEIAVFINLLAIPGHTTTMARIHLYR